MNTLDDAWRWYELVTRQAQLARRFAERVWEELPEDSAVWRDGFFREMDRDQVTAGAKVVASELDDLAVMVLFSVFEATVRQSVLAEVEQEIGHLKHVTLRYAAREALDWIAEGSFFRVLEPFKAGNADLIEEVNQVRRYRNWVAHGRRGNPPNAVTPAAARDRLQRFLDIIQPPASP